MTECEYSFESLVPHTGAMVLLDKVDFGDDQQLQARVTVRADTPLVEVGGLPGWVGMELMAQTIGAFGGLRARRAGQPVKIGFLVGSRKYSCNSPYFPLGATLAVKVQELVRGDNGLCVFECSLSGTGEYSQIQASANINVFQPDNPEEFLQQDISQ